ncbi:MAG: hypothetical protein ACOYLQ_17330 [Hyphomicrobiaceae bacterium]|jgi:hypothetical protein
MTALDLKTLAAAPLLFAAGLWCWTEVRRTSRHWRTATLVTVCIAVGAGFASELIAGRQRGLNELGVGLAGLGWIAGALVARSRRRR